MDEMAGLAKEGMKEGRRCLLSVSTIKLRRLRGFSEAVGRLAETRRAIRGQVELRDACMVVAGKHPRPPGEATIEAVLEGRRTVGHRVGDDESAIRIAHSVAAHRTAEVVLRGPLVPKIAKVCGLRDARPRPWAKDPDTAARIEAMADRFLTAWTPIVLDGRPEDGWFCALVAPRLVGGTSMRGADIVLVSSPDGGGMRTLFLRRDQYPMDGTRTEDGVRREIGWALQSRGMRHANSEGIGRGAGMHSMEECLHEVGIDVSDMQGAVYRDFKARVGMCYVKAERTAIARFRRKLPVDIQDHASLCLHAFLDVRRTAAFLEHRRDWTVESYRRANQAIRLAPFLRGVIARPQVAEAVSRGDALADVVRVAAASDSDVGIKFRSLHAKTVKSLRATWSSAYRPGSDICLTRALWRVVAVIDAIYRKNPHLPVFRASEMQEIANIVGRWPRSNDVGDDVLGDAVLAHRDAKGRVRQVRDVSDMIQWIATHCALVAMKKPKDLDREDIVVSRSDPLVSQIAYRVVFPQGRTFAGVSAMVSEWHAEQRRLDQVFRNTFESMATAKNKCAADDEALLYPHFMKGDEVVDGVTVRPLVDPDAIILEGNAMEHCVGSYVGLASGGRSMLVSMVSADGRSTAEVRLESGADDVPNFYVRQNRAQGNDLPPASHERVLEKMLGKIAKDERVSLAERIEVATKLAGVKAEASYSDLDPEDLVELRRLAHDQMRRFMPRGMRKLSMEEWLAEMVGSGEEIRNAAEAA